MKLLIFIALVCTYALAFRPGFSRSAAVRRLSQPPRMSDDEDSEPVQKTIMMTEGDLSESEDPNMFEMNRRVRLGRSRDQDGKSNIWSIEPTMEVEDEEGSGVTKNLVIAGAVIGAAIACLPLFSALSKLFPDPADF